MEEESRMYEGYFRKDGYVCKRLQCGVVILALELEGVVTLVGYNRSTNGRFPRYHDIGDHPAHSEYRQSGNIQYRLVSMPLPAHLSDLEFRFLSFQ
jgi:hypothetical protein